MTTDPTASTAVTVLFALAGLYVIIRVIVAFSWIDRVSNAVHAVMCIVMAAMPWLTLIPAISQIIFFTVAVFWYIYLALFRPQAESLVGPVHDHHRVPVVLWYHAFMSATMVWMAVAMTPMIPATSMTVTSMTGMDMSQMGHADSGSPAAAITAQQGWAEAVTWLCGIVFVIAAIALLVWTIRRAIGADTFRGLELIGILDLCASTAMAVGMTVSLLALMT